MLQANATSFSVYARRSLRPPAYHASFTASHRRTYSRDKSPAAVAASIKRLYDDYQPIIQEARKKGLVTTHQAFVFKNIEQGRAKTSDKKTLHQAYLSYQCKLTDDPITLFHTVRTLLDKKDVTDKYESYEEIQARLRSCSYRMNTVGSWNLLFAKLLLIKGERGSISKVTRARREMINCGIKPDVYTYMTFFTGYLERARRIQRERNEDRHVVKAEQKFLAIKASDAYVSLANSKANSPIKPTTILLNAAMNVAAAIPDMDCLWRILKYVPDEKECALDHISYGIILKALQRETTKSEIEPARGACSRIKKDEVIVVEDRCQKALVHGKSFWADVLSKWQERKLEVDVKLIVDMARLLLKSEDSDDWRSVFALLRQTVGIPLLDHSLQTTEEHKPRMGSFGPEPSENNAPRAETENLFQPVFLEDGTALSLDLKSLSTVDLNQLLVLLCETCEKLEDHATGKRYTEFFLNGTNFDMTPNGESLTMIIRQHQFARSAEGTREALDKYLPAIEEGSFDHSLFRNAIKTCTLAHRDPSVITHASQIMKYMLQYSKPYPDVFASVAYSRLLKSQPERIWSTSDMATAIQILFAIIKKFNASLRLRKTDELPFAHFVSYRQARGPIEQQVRLFVQDMIELLENAQRLIKTAQSHKLALSGPNIPIPVDRAFTDDIEYLRSNQLGFKFPEDRTQGNPRVKSKPASNDKKLSYVPKSDTISGRRRFEHARQKQIQPTIGPLSPIERAHAHARASIEALGGLPNTPSGITGTAATKLRRQIRSQARRLQGVNEEVKGGSGESAMAEESDTASDSSIQKVNTSSGKRNGDGTSLPARHPEDHGEVVPLYSKEMGSWVRTAIEHRKQYITERDGIKPTLTGYEHARRDWLGRKFPSDPDVQSKPKTIDEIVRRVKTPVVDDTQESLSATDSTFKSRAHHTTQPRIRVHYAKDLPGRSSHDDDASVEAGNNERNKTPQRGKELPVWRYNPQPAPSNDSPASKGTDGTFDTA